MCAVVVYGIGRSNAVRPWAATATTFLLCAAASNSWALDEESAATAIAQFVVPGVSATSLPRFDNIDGTLRSSRIDMSWLPPRRSTWACRSA